MLTPFTSDAAANQDDRDEQHPSVHDLEPARLDLEGDQQMSRGDRSRPRRAAIRQAAPPAPERCSAERHGGDRQAACRSRQRLALAELETAITAMPPTAAKRPPSAYAVTRDRARRSHRWRTRSHRWCPLRRAVRRYGMSPSANHTTIRNAEREERARDGSDRAGEVLQPLRSDRLGRRDHPQIDAEQDEVHRERDHDRRHAQQLDRRGR